MDATTREYLLSEVGASIVSLNNARTVIDHPEFFHVSISRALDRIRGVLAVSRDPTLISTCAQCGATIAHTGRGRTRRSRAYCSNACRSRAYRQRQAEAIRLRQEGTSIEDIAKALESTPAVVARWVGEA